MPKILIEIDTDTQCVVPKIPMPEMVEAARIASQAANWVRCDVPDISPLARERVLINAALTAAIEAGFAAAPQPEHVREQDEKDAARYWWLRRHD